MRAVAVQSALQQAPSLAVARELLRGLRGGSGAVAA